MIHKLQVLDFWFIGWGALLALNAIVGLADYLQDGTAWPVNLVAIFLMLVVRLTIVRQKPRPK